MGCWWRWWHFSTTIEGYFGASQFPVCFQLVIPAGMQILDKSVYACVLQNWTSIPKIHVEGKDDIHGRLHVVISRKNKKLRDSLKIGNMFWKLEMFVWCCRHLKSLHTSKVFDKYPQLVPIGGGLLNITYILRNCCLLSFNFNVYIYIYTLIRTVYISYTMGFMSNKKQLDKKILPNSALPFARYTLED